MPLSLKVSKKVIKSLFILTCLVITGIAGYFAYINLIKPHVNQSNEDNGKNIVKQEIDKNKFPPVQDPTQAGVVPNIQDTINESKYSFGITSLGNPTYTFLLFYNKAWVFTSRDISHVLFTDTDKKVQYGMRFWGKQTKQYLLTCEQIVKQNNVSGAFSSVLKEEQTLNSLKWDRVGYDLSLAKVKYHGVSQCYKNTDGLFEQFLLVTSDYWDKRDSDIMSMFDKIKVSKDGVAW